VGRLIETASRYEGKAKPQYTGNIFLIFSGTGYGENEENPGVWKVYSPRDFEYYRLLKRGHKNYAV
jgi:hypothetical protein